MRRGDGERREERLLDGERWRRPHGEGERDRRGLGPRPETDLEAAERELREAELLFSLDRLEDGKLERTLVVRYMTMAPRRARLLALVPTPLSRPPTPLSTLHAHAHRSRG